MRAINAWMCPWLIAAFGKNYADWDNVDAAMLMLSHVIVTSVVFILLYDWLCVVQEY